MKKIANPNQLSLLEILKDLRPKVEISIENIDVLFRATLTETVKKSGLSRIQIAARMTEALDIEITKTIIDSWTAESREGVNRFPACYLPVFCEVVGSLEPYRVLADLNGAYVIEGPEALDLELKRIENQKKELAEKERAIKTLRQGLGK
jgi:hypothetical protein